MDSSLMNVADSDDHVGLQTPTQEGVLTCVLRRLDKQPSRPSGMPNIADPSNCCEREPLSPSIASAVPLSVVPQRHVLGCPVLCGALVPLRPLLAEVHGHNDTELVVMSDDVASQRGICHHCRMPPISCRRRRPRWLQRRPRATWVPCLLSGPTAAAADPPMGKRVFSWTYNVCNGRWLLLTNSDRCWQIPSSRRVLSSRPSMMILQHVS